MTDRAGDAVRAAEGLASRLPAELRPLARLAFNYRWSWTPGGADVFRAIDERRFELCAENPVRLLQEAPASSLERAARDGGLVRRAGALLADLEAELSRPASDDGPSAERPIAFFCAEFAIHRSLPIYAGGLGVLAGDILKEASDQALPFVGVGILYRQGYFQQRIDGSGWQQEHWAMVDPGRLPAALVTTPDGRPVTVGVPLRGREVTVQVWRVDVGRVPLFLLDADRPENAAMDRWITSRLYVADRRTRLAQYAVLGLGGIRALRAMGIDPGVVHLNEGHAVFSALELAQDAVAAGRGFDAALAECRAGIVFTTHTPVEAGNEAYTEDELLAVLGDAPGGVPMDRLLSLGRVGDDRDGPFALTPVGIRVSRATNGVSRRHGAVARGMWHSLFADRPEDEVPVGHVTNGVHVPSWMAPPMRALLDRHLGEGWPARAADPATWDPIDAIPDEELWAVRSELRSGLVGYVRDRNVADRLARGERSEEVEEGPAAFDPNALTIGFARRLAAYKRLYLLIHDPARILGLLDGTRPLQLFLAGKAHPSDDQGKDILRWVFDLLSEPVAAARVAFLENYDLGVATRLVWGCDVWVNLPRPPLEASGTSGMKAALNGGLNLSVLDGWWDEAFDGTNGWGIATRPNAEPEEQDAEDGGTFYDLLERDVVPLFHERDGAGIPRAWLRRVKASLRTIGPRFSATRMVNDYRSKVY